MPDNAAYGKRGERVRTYRCHVCGTEHQLSDETARITLGPPDLCIHHYRMWLLEQELPAFVLRTTDSPAVERFYLDH
jgi:hypothetical protein